MPFTFSGENCPVCGCLVKQDDFDVKYCCSCPFKCFGEDFARISAAMSLDCKDVKQLLSYTEAREREGWYNDSKDVFERRHVSIKDKLQKLVLVAVQRD